MSFHWTLRLVDTEACRLGSELSTNSRWWDSSSSTQLFSRLNLNESTNCRWWYFAFLCKVSQLSQYRNAVASGRVIPIVYSRLPIERWGNKLIGNRKLAIGNDLIAGRRGPVVSRKSSIEIAVELFLASLKMMTTGLDCVELF
jgi:hypothetical protein